MVLGTLGVLLVVIAVLWAFGGLQARPDSVAAVGPGTAVDQGLFTVQVIDARSGQMKLHPYDPMANLLAVRMRVTNNGEQSYGMTSFLDGISAEPKPGKYADADAMRTEGQIQGNETSTIHPRLPVTVQVVWVLPNGVAPRSIVLALRTWNYGQGFTDDDIYWSVTKQSPMKARVTVPVSTGATS